ncbi:lipoprotein [Leadbettera azotonutricia]|uniref:Putative lipoprotein n=1 Tax=Leadbettera azotonutricia (strain ATCC BAA-888 / DSM 13862 / ZAS-9) TaxID=545695 RepID=F5Y734_LEAAZ|nr:lipoprotein [Leadbettera azotonutricia]AEF82704.1 putative lipoprotein [Leadbettera azotonutricia ZAS-9]
MRIRFKIGNQKTCFAKEAGTIVLLISLLISCTGGVGLGDTVDLAAPVLTVDTLIDTRGNEINLKTYRGLIFVGAEFTFKGTAYDNKAAERLVVEELLPDGSVRRNRSTLDEEPLPILGKPGNQWVLTIRLKEDGERTFRFTLSDHAGNISAESSVKQITLMVDTDGPAVTNLEIERRPGIRYPLKSQQELEDLDASDYIHIDAFQNESFTLKGTVEESFIPVAAELTLKDENGSIVIDNMERNGGGPFSPAWFITHDDIINYSNNHPELGRDYSTGKHYFRAEVESRDQAGNVNTDFFGYLCWYPESDIPRPSVDQAGKGNIVNIAPGLPISIWVSDDDSIAEVYFAFFTLSEWETNIPGMDDEARLEYLMNSSNATAKLGPSRIGAPGSIQRFFATADDPGKGKNVLLAISAKDRKSSGTAGVWKAALFRVNYLEADKPSIVIQSPQENSIPQIGNDGSFTISGYVLDIAGADRIRLAWIPGNDAGKVNETKEGLDQPTLPSGGTIKYWELIPGPMSDAGDSLIQQDFSKPFNIFSDFPGEERDPKLFVLYASSFGGVTTRTFRLSGNNVKPEIDLAATSDVQDILQDFVFRFTATGIGNLDIEIQEIQGISVIHTYTPEFTGTEWSRLIPKADTQDKERAKYRVTVTDQLGNTNFADITVLFTEIPILLHITSGMSNGSITKESDSVILYAEFSKPVQYVNGTPKLRLGFTPEDTSWKLADYTGGAGTSILAFTYHVMSGDYSAKLHSAASPIEAASGNISAVIPGIGGTPAWTGDSGSLQKNKTLVVDGIAPLVTAMDVSGQSSGWYAGRETLTFTLTLTENALVSGSPKLVLSGITGAASPAAIFSRTDGQNILFTYTPEAGEYTAGKTLRAEGIDLNGGSITDYAENSFDENAAANTALTGTAANPASLNPETGIDAVPPFTPGLKQVLVNGEPGSGNLVSGLFKSLSFILDASADSADPGSPRTAQYSLNGGMSWIGWTTGNIALPGGAHQITVRASDAAGNISPVPTPLAITVNGTFPLLDRIICEQPAKTYPAGQELVFNLVFADKVYTLPGTTATITLKGGASGDSQNRIAGVIEQLGDAATLAFSYTIQAGDVMSPITISSVDLSGVQDLYGNTKSGYTAAELNDKSVPDQDLKADAIPPVISSYSPVHFSGSSGSIIGSDRKITLTYSEPVYKESGIITLRPAANWHIPPVIAEAEFLNIPNYNALVSDSAGYKKTTQGLNVQGNTYVPDTDSKYVLSFNLGLDNAGLRIFF